MQWEPVEYFDNKIICDLVESKPNGIIAIMVSNQLVQFLRRLISSFTTTAGFPANATHATNLRIYELMQRKEHNETTSLLDRG